VAGTMLPERHACGLVGVSRSEFSIAVLKVVGK